MKYFADHLDILLPLVPPTYVGLKKTQMALDLDGQEGDNKLKSESWRRYLARISIFSPVFGSLEF